jgi:Spo0E like sporulation regulatory protein
MDKRLLELLLMKRINRLKKKMVMVAEITGMNSYQTVLCSQELDKLLNLHMKHFSGKSRKMLNHAS